MGRTFDGLRAILGDVNPAAGDAADSGDPETTVEGADGADGVERGDPAIDAFVNPPPEAEPHVASAELGAPEPEGNPELDLQLRALSPTEEDSRPIAASVAADVLQPVAPVAQDETAAAVAGEPPVMEAVDSGQSADAPVDDLGLLDLDRGVYDGDSPARPAETRSPHGEAVAPVPVNAEPAADGEAPVVDPGLLDLDRGLFDGADSTARSSDPEGLNDLDFSARPPGESPQRRVDREPAGNRRRIDPDTSQPPLTTRLIRPDDSKTPFAPDGAPRVNAHGMLVGHVNEWTAAIVLILSMFLGASAAVAVFHDRVSQLFARLG
jgi:hypothetical protein